MLVVSDGNRQQHYVDEASVAPRSDIEAALNAVCDRRTTRGRVGVKGSLLLLVSVLLVIACDGQRVQVTQVLRRSATQTWQVKHSQAVGVQVEVPADICGYAEAPNIGLAIQLHTVPAPRFVLDDKKCLMDIKIERKKKDDFEREIALPVGRRKDDADWKWLYARHDSIDRRQQGLYTVYRYDFDCRGGDVVTTLTNVTNVYERGTSLYEKEDDAIVRRILGSLRCLDVPGR